ncbi:MAG: hypothetical protein ABIP20_17010 [Chthoniobacteraceae bacterium]
MAKKSDRKPTVESPIQSKQQKLELLAEKLKAEINKRQEFLKKAPALKDEAQKKQQRELVERFNRPARIEGPVDFRLDFVREKKSAPPKKLRKERSKAPLVTFVLFVTFVVVAYFAWKSLWQG